MEWAALPGEQWKLAARSSLAVVVVVVVFVCDDRSLGVSSTEVEHASHKSEAFARSHPQNSPRASLSASAVGQQTTPHEIFDTHGRNANENLCLNCDDNQFPLGRQMDAPIRQ
jgi:hypothetical protein